MSDYPTTADEITLEWLTDRFRGRGLLESDKITRLASAGAMARLDEHKMNTDNIEVRISLLLRPGHGGTDGTESMTCLRQDQIQNPGASARTPNFSLAQTPSIPECLGPKNTERNPAHPYLHNRGAKLDAPTP